MISSRYRTIQSLALAGLLALVVLAACSPEGNSDASATTAHDPDDYPGGEILVNTEWVADNLDDPNLRIIDLSSIGTYREGHLPGAVHVWWQDTIEIHNDVYGMMADPQTREELFRHAGIDEDSFVVVYDDEGGRYASRFLWMLHFINFERVALLHGGRQAWENDGFDITTEVPDVDPGGLHGDANYDVLIGADDVQALLDNPEAMIIDGRTDEERDETWFDRLRTGRIPGSVRFPHDQTTQDGEVPYFRGPDELQNMLSDDFGPDDEGPIVVYGLHGVAAGHTYVTLRLLGYDSVRLYDGSWAEWGADENRPIED